jgi:hypothetical protein
MLTSVFFPRHVKFVPQQLFVSWISNLSIFQSDLKMIITKIGPFTNGVATTMECGIKEKETTTIKRMA